MLDRYTMKVVDHTKIWADDEREEWTEAFMEPHKEGSYVLYSDVVELLTKEGGKPYAESLVKT